MLCVLPCYHTNMKNYQFSATYLFRYRYFVTSKKRNKYMDPDPCSPFMDKYLLCVASKKEGLREGDECGSEGVSYKVCRVSELKKKKEKTSPPKSSKIE